MCAWQYVYGTNPVGEAELGAQGGRPNGADCLVIDAESQYEGLYGAAQTYIDTLRAKIGPAYPLGLASFPYVNYHPSFPYSVFLGPNGAQFNAPQMYWHDIGTSVAQVYVNTYEQNLIYGRPILPLGQTYGGVSASEIVAFRSLASAYGAAGDSFWDWQETSTSGWTSMARTAEHEPDGAPAGADLAAAARKARRATRCCGCRSTSRARSRASRRRASSNRRPRRT